MNIPNILTVVRFVIIPVFAYYLYLGSGYYIVAVSLFLLAGLTDFLDGFIARKYNMITSFGKLADPLADKLLQITALFILTFQGKIPWIILFIIILKEGFMATGGILLYKRENYVVSSNWYGKVATVIFYFAIVMIIFNAPYSDVYIIIAALSALFAFFMYVLAYKKIKDKIREGQKQD